MTSTRCRFRDGLRSPSEPSGRPMTSMAAMTRSLNREDIMKNNARPRAVRGLAGLGSAARFVYALGLVSANLLTGCKDLLTPENPGEILAEDLKDPKALPILIAGVAGDYNYMYSY